MLTRTELSFDISDRESRVRACLSQRYANCTLEACGHLAVILNDVFASLVKTNPYRWWSVDTLSCESSGVVSSSVVTLAGSAYWFNGGEGCDSFKLDVDIGALLYSYKFLTARNAKQVLYVAKMPHDWVISAA
jgi:hypothetical protein